MAGWRMIHRQGQRVHCQNDDYFLPQLLGQEIAI